MEWTVETLKALLDERHAAQQESVRTALQSSERAVEKVEVSLDKRLATLNEFRSTVEDVLQTRVTKAEADASSSRLADSISRNTLDIQNLQEYMFQQQGRHRGVADGYGYIVGAVGIVVAIVSFFL